MTRFYIRDRQTVSCCVCVEHKGFNTHFLCEETNIGRKKSNGNEDVLTSCRQLFGVDYFGSILLSCTQLNTSAHHWKSSPGRCRGNTRLASADHRHEIKQNHVSKCSHIRMGHHTGVSYHQHPTPQGRGRQRFSYRHVQRVVEETDLKPGHQDVDFSKQCESYTGHMGSYRQTLLRRRSRAAEVVCVYGNKPSVVINFLSCFSLFHDYYNLSTLFWVHFRTKCQNSTCLKVAISSDYIELNDFGLESYFAPFSAILLVKELINYSKKKNNLRKMTEK